MRAVFVVATLLCLSSPAISWGAIDPSSSAASTISLAAPTTTASQISRAVAKVDKTFGLGCAIFGHGQPILLPEGSVELDASQCLEPPNVDLEGPPLAPRPPPLC